MSILVENGFGWVLSHEKALDEIYSHIFCGNDSCSTDKSEAGVRFKTDLFNIFTPFKMDSQRKIESVAATEAGAGEEGEMTARKRKVIVVQVSPLNISVTWLIWLFSRNQVPISIRKHFYIMMIPCCHTIPYLC